MSARFRSLLGLTVLSSILFGCIGLLQAAEIVTYPYLGITYIKRTETSPRNMNINIMKIDLTAPGLGFKLSPPGGTRDTVRQTTLNYLTAQLAQVAMNIHFFLPCCPAGDLNADLIGFAASNGNVFSPFELPTQNYALVRDAPAVNIDPANHASIVTAAPGFSDGTCLLCGVNDGIHINESVTLWNTVSGSAQIVTNGVQSLPCYVDATHPDCKLVGPGPAMYSNANSWYNLINARAAAGISQDGNTLFLFTVDAAGGSAGMRVGEVADMLISYGAYNALNLDGGGSTSMAMQNPLTLVRSLLNVPSGAPRLVGTSLAVFAAADVTAPSTTATVAPTPNGDGWNKTNVTVTLDATDNAGGHVKQIEYSLAGAQTLASQVVAGSTTSFPITAEGVTTVTYFAKDVSPAQNTETAHALPVKIDKTLPAISGMPGANCKVWPVDNKMVSVATISASDALSGLGPDALSVTGTSNEPTDPAEPDILVTSDGSGGFTVELRAKRLGQETGRTYTLTATATDIAGNVRTSTSTCTVPHDMGKNP